MLVWPRRIGVCGGLAVARRSYISDHVAVGGCRRNWRGVDVDYSNHECVAAGADIDESD